jgi:hypothetical protein
MSACLQRNPNEPPKVCTVPEGSTPQSVCDAIHEKSKNIEEAISETAGAFSPASFISAFKSKSDSKSTLINSLKTKFSTSSVLNQTNSCSNLVSNSQSNIIKGQTPACIEVLIKGGFTKDEIRSSVSDISQSNSTDQQAICEMQLLISALSNMDASIDNSALQQTLNKASGVLSTSASNQKSCNEITADMTACKYIQQDQCCNNELRSTQLNLLEAGCATSMSKIKQDNKLSQLERCKMGSSSVSEDQAKQDLKNKGDQKSENLSEGVTAAAIIASIIGCLVCLSLIAAVAYYVYDRFYK